MENRIKVIIDMDIGDDIDDAFALLLAMELNFDIVGITTVFKNTHQRAKIAKKMLTLYGKGYENVPVFSGYGTPLHEERADHPTLMCQYTNDLEDKIYAPESENCEDAVDFIIDSCRKYRDELTVIAIGPFTNIAKVIEKDKDALNLAKEIIIMGGAYYKQYTDWNVICDVEAAKIMFDGINDIKCIGADVTHMLRISEEDDKVILNYSKNSEVHKYVAELYKLWKQKKGACGVLHDPLAIYYAYDKSICNCETASVTVLTDGFARGLTLNVNAYGKSHMNTAYKGFDYSKTHTLAKSVDREKMIEAFMKWFR